MTNKLVWQEGTEIAVDTEVATAATGWTLNYVSVGRLGDLVIAHLEATSDGTGTGLVTTLPSDFAPGAVVTSADGAFTIGTDGHVTRVAGGGVGVARLEVSFFAGESSP